MLYLLVLLGFIFFAGVAMTINEGLWNNTLLLISLLLSGIAAIVAGVPLGVMLLEQMGLAETRAWYAVFAGIWGVFAVSMLVLRILTDKASGTRVRFLPVVDKIGGILTSLLVALMLASFSAYTLERVPIKAGEWAASDASAAQRQYFALARNPFRIVVKNFTKAEGADSPFYGQ